MKNVLVPAILLIAFTSFAQSPITNESLQEQYQDIRENSESYNEYKVIKAQRLDQFWSNVQAEQSKLNAEINGLNTTINDLQSQVAEKEEQKNTAEAAMNDLQYEADHISVAGIDFSKSGFTTLAGFTVLGLLIGMGLTTFLFKQSLRESRKTAHLLNEVETDYQNYRQRSLDKYVKLKRDYQTVQNQLSEMNRTERRSKVTV